MIVDYNKNYLLSGGEGNIDIWKIETKPGGKDINMSLIQTVKDPDISKNNTPKINDFILLPRVNVMVVCNNNKKWN